MDNFHVIYQNKGWVIKGAEKPTIYETKTAAIEVARKLAENKNRSVIIHRQDGEISSVLAKRDNFAKGQKIRRAKVKRRLDEDKVRTAIANAMARKSLNE